jgi:hypothetical protein
LVPTQAHYEIDSLNENLILIRGIESKTLVQGIYQSFLMLQDYYRLTVATELPGKSYRKSPLALEPSIDIRKELPSGRGISMSMSPKETGNTLHLVWEPGSGSSHAIFPIFCLRQGITHHYTTLSGSLCLLNMVGDNSDSIITCSSLHQTK